MSSRARKKPRKKRKTAPVRPQETEEEYRNRLLNMPALPPLKPRTLAPYRVPFRFPGEPFYDFHKFDSDTPSEQGGLEQGECSEAVPEDAGPSRPRVEPRVDSSHQGPSTSEFVRTAWHSVPEDPRGESDGHEILSSIVNQVTQLEEFFLGEEGMYSSLLKTDASVVTITDNLFLVMPDLDFTKASLKKNALVLLQRKPASFLDDDPRWIVVCSCQPEWSREILSLSNTLHMTYEGFTRQYHPCLHRHVGGKIFESYDNLHDISVADFLLGDFTDEDHLYSTESQIVKASSLNGLPVFRTWVEPDNSYGLISVLNGKFYCFCCQKNYCAHTKHFRNLPVNDVGLALCEVEDLHKLASAATESTGGPTESRTTIRCHSTNKIPFHATGHITERFKEGLLSSLPTSEEGHLLFVPKIQMCLHCGCALATDDPVSNECIAADNVLVVTLTQLKTGKVYYRRCTGCDGVSLYDGLDDCFINMGSFLVGYDVLRTYLHSFLLGRRPLHTFYCSFVDDHMDYGNDVANTFPYRKLLASWNAFLERLDFDENNGFTCSKCDEEGGPDMFICDGTSVSFQRRMWAWNQETPIQKNTYGSRFNERVCIKDARTRSLLHRYAVGGAYYRKKRPDVLTRDEKDELMRKLSSYPAVHTFMLSIDDGSVHLPPQFLHFVASLASKSPVCSYLQPSATAERLIGDLVSGYAIKNDPEKWHSLSCELPLIFHLLERDNGVVAPVELRPLLEALWVLATAPFQHEEAIQECSITEDEMSFFPSRPIVRSRGAYAADVTRQDKNCSKNYKGHPSLLPGIFTIYCPHGICHGFQVMPTNESPNVPFTIFRTRFRKAPRIIIYDNACALHAYCLNRDPIFFRDTTFLVDRLHWDNHTGCSSGYCLDIYPSLKVYNSQVVEQANAGLKKIKAQLSYMTAMNFMRHCKLFLWNKNNLKSKCST